MAQRQFKSTDDSKWLDGFGNSSDGVLTYTGGNFGGTTGHGFGLFTGTAGNYYGTFSDVAYFNGGNGGRVDNIVLIHQTQGTGVGNWELNKIISRVSTTLNLKYPLVNSYAAGAQVVSSGNFSAATFTNTTTPSIDWSGSYSAGGIFFLVVNGLLTVTGSINVTGKGYLGGNLTTSGGYSGEGTLGDRNSRTSSYGNAGGGVTPSVNAAGDGGGNGTAGSEGQQSAGGGGSAGAAAGAAALTTSVFGGGGSTSNAVEQQTGAIGGAGGGMILIIAKNITITGSIVAGGVAGGNSTGGDYSRGGGGGAGGSILLKSQVVVLGTNLVTAPAGAGGAASGGAHGNQIGGAGGVGRIHMDYKTSYTGTTNPAIDVTQDLTLNDPNTGGFLRSYKFSIIKYDI